MSTGPILIFDKSMLEALSPDEAVWLGQFYRINITPLFFVETLADLEKAPRDDRTPEQVVERLAEKTSALHSDPNVHHQRLCVSELLGREIEMRRFVVMEGGRFRRMDAPESSSTEAQKLRRWTAGGADVFRRLSGSKRGCGALRSGTLTWRPWLSGSGR